MTVFGLSWEIWLLITLGLIYLQLAALCAALYGRLALAGLNIQERRWTLALRTVAFLFLPLVILFILIRGLPREKASKDREDLP